MTLGELTVSEFLVGDGKHFRNYQEIPDILRENIAFAVRKNTPAIIDSQEPENIKIVGANPTGIALLRFLGSDAAVQDDVLIEKNIPFQSANKFSASQIKGNKNITLVKGAAEIVLKGVQITLMKKVK